MIIRLPRGNTLRINVVLTDINKNPYIMGKNDCAVFTIKTTGDRNETPISQITIFPSDCGKNGELQIKINPEDTISLKEGTYLYDLAVCIDGEEFYTTIIADTLQILPALSDIYEVKKYGRYFR